MALLVSSGDLGFLERHLKTELGTPNEVGVFLNVSIYMFEMIAVDCTEVKEGTWRQKYSVK